ncbi:hypothetical protein ElyMa_006400100 [Elysia marginata]|uniref:Uncharacterized protein n=1 Tax=Elysia marginata TaxID=1093978 RepID=A0AAV4HTG2_9GAST|nr:hypothetical protein ElyMa_006400100 [Elysia marginata]
MGEKKEFSVETMGEKIEFSVETMGEKIEFSVEFMVHLALSSRGTSLTEHGERHKNEDILLASRKFSVEIMMQPREKAREQRKEPGEERCETLPAARPTLSLYYRSV